MEVLAKAEEDACEREKRMRRLELEVEEEGRQMTGVRSR